jgi:hypothetical protein
MPAKPIDHFSSELVTLLEFVRVAMKGFPKTTDKILTHMDLADEAFMEDINALAAEVSFDFDEEPDNEPADE